MAASGRSISDQYHGGLALLDQDLGFLLGKGIERVTRAGAEHHRKTG